MSRDLSKPLIQPVVNDEQYRRYENIADGAHYDLQAAFLKFRDALRLDKAMEGAPSAADCRRFRKWLYQRMATSLQRQTDELPD